MRARRVLVNLSNLGNHVQTGCLQDQLAQTILLLEKVCAVQESLAALFLFGMPAVSSILKHMAEAANSPDNAAGQRVGSFGAVPRGFSAGLAARHRPALSG